MFTWIRLQFWLWWYVKPAIRKTMRRELPQDKAGLQRYLIDLCEAGVEDGAIEDPWADLRDYWAQVGSGEGTTDRTEEE